MEGTDLAKYVDNCVCRPDYYGTDCGIPDAVWFGNYVDRKLERENLRIRKVPRRIIHGVPVNHEFDFFETRVKSLGDVVDAFIIQVSVVYVAAAVVVAAVVFVVVILQSVSQIWAS